MTCHKNLKVFKNWRGLLLCTCRYRPYALTSRLHNDAMLGVKTCRAARTCCAGRALLSASQSVHGPGPARRYGMQGLARWLHAWRWSTWQCLVDPQHVGAPFCDVICIRSIKKRSFGTVKGMSLQTKPLTPPKKKLIKYDSQQEIVVWE